MSMEKLNDNEVAEAAKMQRRLDAYETCLSDLFFFIRKGRTPIRQDICDEVLWYEDMEDFVRYISDRHPDIMEEYRAKGRDFRKSYKTEPSEPIQ